MESHPILITTRDSSHATQRRSNVLERTFLTAADHDNRPRIHEMTKRYPKDSLFARCDKLCTRMSPDHGNLFFASPDTFSKTQMSYEDEVHRQLRAYYIFRDLFSVIFESIDSKYLFGEIQFLSITRLYPVSLYVKLSSVRIELRQIQVF